jgi:hypothetical protein
MKSWIFLAGVALAVLNTSLVSAQDDGCRRDGNGRIIGTAVGAGAGGVLGNVIAGRGDKTEGSIIGAVVGAVIGNQVSKSNRGDCRYAYGFFDEQGRWHATGVSANEARGYYDRNGAWVDGKPNGYYDNGRWVMANGDRKSAGYIDREGHWVPATSVGYYDRNNRWVSGSATGYYDLNQMPTDISRRISWMREYIRDSVQSQQMSRASAQYARRELTAVEAQNRQFNRDGRFTAREEQTIRRRLDRLTTRFEQSERQGRNN